MSEKYFYITTTLPYVNADPHIGFALEIIQADTVARYKRKNGYKVFFNFGTDEHGLKIYKKAKEKGIDTKKYCDHYAKKFNNLKKCLNLSYDGFIRTTDTKHERAVRKFWALCLKNNDIYKKNYKIKYCVGCELEKTDSELQNDKCPLHPNQKLEIIDEENYFFKFSKYQEGLLDFYNKNPNFVIPEFRQKEIQSFVKNGLNDFSVSRLKEKMPWGISVPNDDKHVIYVWFDALINYISTLGWPESRESFNNFWPGTQVAGKDNLRQQAAIWQAMLMSAKVPNSKQIFIHGFITADGQKISKSFGNLVDPYDIVNKYSTDSLRYYLLSNIHPFEDGDFTIEKFETVYNADLANGIGNLVSRVVGLSKDLKFKITKPKTFSKKVAYHLDHFRFDKSLKHIWGEIKKCDIEINRKKIWELDKKGRQKNLKPILDKIRQIGFDLSPFIPETSKRIENMFSEEKIEVGRTLFPRLDK